MKDNILILYMIFLFFFELIIINSEYIYESEDIINFINNENLGKEYLNDIIDNIIKTFNDAYAFNDISKNPPQPSFQTDYFNKIDINQRLNEIKDKINNDEITEKYDFYRELNIAFSELKDSHIILIWNLLNIEDYTIIAPIEFYTKQVDNEIKIFANCLDSDDDYFSDNGIDIAEELDLCDQNKDNPILSINNQNPFDFINNFGQQFLSTKNEHATFSFKLQNHNYVQLKDYPLSLEELNRLDIEFETGTTINTKYYILSEIDINNERRNLNNNNFTLYKKEINNKKRTINKNSKKRKLDEIYWNYKEKNELLKCYEDNNNEINIYYISSFNVYGRDKDDYIKIIENCYKLFDTNTYPIVIINDLNEGGLVYLSQLFLGIISPLMSIDLYKGRIRITDTFKNTDEIKYYIESNLTSSKNCLHTSYNDLINNKIQVDYGDEIKSDLTDIFYLNNITLHNYIEKARKEMEHKRKPTEILIYTDGYTFSAASLFLTYLQKSGGGIIASYLGNPNLKNDKYFDISQSPSPIFNHKLLKIFSPDNYINLNSNDENEWEIQMPGIQTFYDLNDYKIPLEYEVILPDINSEIYEIFNEETYEKFISKSKSIFEKYKNECNPKNKNLVKVSEECDNKFGDSYTHGGYQCGDERKWTNICVPSYCDPGYFFNRKEMKCVKDICSSIPVQLIEDIDTEQNTEINESDGKQKNHSNNKYISIIVTIFLIILFF